MKTQIEQLSEWVASFTLDMVPENTQELARLQVLDCVASITAGFRSRTGNKIYNALKSIASETGQHNILTTGEQWSLENSVYLHAALINALELDNFSYMGHLSQSAFSVAHGVSEKVGASNKEFLEAFICAQEVSGRLAAYMASGPLQGHMRSFIHRIGSAVATARLYKCTAEVTANAMAISLSSPEFPMFPTSFSPETKITCVSSASIEGMRAAFLAMHGLSGALDIIEHPAGFVKSFSNLNNVPVFWHSLGKTWVIDSVSFKYFSSCGYSQGPVNAVLDAIKHKSVSPQDIESIQLHCPLLTIVMEAFSKPHYKSGLNPVNINFSTKRSVSAAILHKGLDGDFFANGNDENFYAEIIDLSEKINIHHNWRLTIEMIKGMDDCLENPGYPGIFDMDSSDHTLKKLRKVYRNRTIFNLFEFSQLLQLPRGYLQYLLRRVYRSYSGRTGLSDVRSFENDLSKLQFKIGTIAEIRLKNGDKITGTCELPKGFAGDPEKKLRVIEKFKRECYPYYGIEDATSMLSNILKGNFPARA